MNSFITLELAWKGSTYFNNAFEISTLDISMPSFGYQSTASLQPTRNEALTQNLYFQAINPKGLASNVMTRSLTCSSLNAQDLKVTARLFQKVVSRDFMVKQPDGTYEYAILDRRFDFLIEIQNLPMFEHLSGYRLNIVHENTKLIGIFEKVFPQNNIENNNNVKDSSKSNEVNDSNSQTQQKNYSSNEILFQDYTTFDEILFN